MKVVPRGALAALLAAFGASPAFAQIDLSGEWNPLFHEDQPERIPGPEIGDYLGLPISDAARDAGRYLGRRHPDAAGASVQAAPVRLRRARAGESAHLERSGPGDAADYRVAHAYFLAGSGTDHLYGWAAASAGVCSAHLAGIFDRASGTATC